VRDNVNACHSELVSSDQESMAVNGFAVADPAVKIAHKACDLVLPLRSKSTSLSLRSRSPSSTRPAAPAMAAALSVPPQPAASAHRLLHPHHRRVPAERARHLRPLCRPPPPRPHVQAGGVPGWKLGRAERPHHGRERHPHSPASPPPCKIAPAHPHQSFSFLSA
jgi:hypothetical protein